MRRIIRTVIFEHLCSEVRAIIGDDAVGYTKSEDYRSDEVDYSGDSRTCNWHGFDPLGKFVDSNEQVSVSTRDDFLKGPTMSSPH